MLKLIDKSGKDNKQFSQMVTKFYPYAQKKLGFKEPVTCVLISDPENARNPIGKTAYYEPDSHKITIYVDRRHPKDMLRSFSHELVHHKQNCDGNFSDQTAMEGGYAQNDEHLRNMEADAYLNGNFNVRDFEDQLKYGTKPGGVQQAMQESVMKKVKDFIKEKKIEHPGEVDHGTQKYGDKFIQNDKGEWVPNPDYRGRKTQKESKSMSLAEKLLENEELIQKVGEFYKKRKENWNNEEHQETDMTERDVTGETDDNEEEDDTVNEALVREAVRKALRRVISESKKQEKKADKPEEKKESLVEWKNRRLNEELMKEWCK